MQWWFNFKQQKSIIAFAINSIMPRNPFWERLLRSNAIAYCKGTMSKWLCWNKTVLNWFHWCCLPHCQSNYAASMIHTKLWPISKFFNPNIKKPLEKQGPKTVSICVNNAGKKRATLSVTIYGNGQLLKPCLVFKVKPGGRIERNLTSFCADCHYGVQEKAWMDEWLLHYWFDIILAPDIKTVSPGIFQA